MTEIERVTTEIERQETMAEALLVQREELWELSIQDHESIDELVACLRWAAMVAEMHSPQSSEKIDRCKAALAVHDAGSDEVGEPRAAFEEGE